MISNMFWKKKNNSEKRVHELESDKKTLNRLVHFLEQESKDQKNQIRQLNQKISKDRESKIKWFKLGRLISSIPFESKQKLVQDRGIELIKHLQKNQKS